MPSEFVCDHATDPKCPWRGCPHRKPHRLRPRANDCHPDSWADCCDKGIVVVFPRVRCVPVKGAPDAE